MKETYFKQLHGVLTEIKRDEQALAVLALTERRGFLDEEKEYVNLSNMYMYMDIPLKAAQILDRGLTAKQVQPTEKNLEKLANAWFAAREHEKAEEAMARAAQASDKGDLWKQVASIQMEREKWKEALASLQKAQQKGGSKNPGEVQFLMGVTATQLRQWKTAETALRAAMQHEKWVKPATEWLSHLHEEQAYLEATSSKDEKGDQDGKDGKDQAPAADAAKS
jgi:tetratricopeptide (TPR) repeat protein